MSWLLGLGGLALLIGGLAFRAPVPAVPSALGTFTGVLARDLRLALGRDIGMADTDVVAVRFGTVTYASTRIAHRLASGLYSVGRWTELLSSIPDMTALKAAYVSLHKRTVQLETT